MNIDAIRVFPLGYVRERSIDTPLSQTMPNL